MLLKKNAPNQIKTSINEYLQIEEYLTEAKKKRSKHQLDVILSLDEIEQRQDTL